VPSRGLLSSTAVSSSLNGLQFLAHLLSADSAVTYQMSCGLDDGLAVVQYSSARVCATVEFLGYCAAHRK